MLKLKELYYDPNENTSSANRLYEAAKRNNVICQKRLKRLLAETALMDTARDHGPASRR